MHPWRKIILLLSNALHLLEVQVTPSVVLVILSAPIGHPIHEHCIVFASRFLGKAKKDSRALLGDAHNDQDGEDDNEDGAKGETKLALVPTNVLARLLREQAKLLPAGHAPPIFFLIVVPRGAALLPSIVLLLVGDFRSTALSFRFGRDSIALLARRVLRVIYEDDLRVVLALPNLQQKLGIIVL